MPAMAPVEIAGDDSGVGEGPCCAGVVLDGTGMPGRGVDSDGCMLPVPAARLLEDVIVDDVLDDDDEGLNVTVDTFPLSESVAVTTTVGWNKSSYWMLHRTNSSLAS